MHFMKLYCLYVCVISVLLTAPFNQAVALNEEFEWDGSSSVWEDSTNWYNTSNPIDAVIDDGRFPDDSTDTANILSGPDVRLGANRRVGWLAIDGGGDLYTGYSGDTSNSYTLRVDHDLYLWYDETGLPSLFLYESGESVDLLVQDTLSISNYARLEMIGGPTVRVDDLLILSAYSGNDGIKGNGDLRLGGDETNGFHLGGNLTASGGTLEVNRTVGATSLIECAPGAGLYVENGSTLDINVPFGDLPAFGSNDYYDLIG